MYFVWYVSHINSFQLSIPFTLFFLTCAHWVTGFALVSRFLKWFSPILSWRSWRYYKSCSLQYIVIVGIIFRCHCHDSTWFIYCTVWNYMISFRWVVEPSTSYLLKKLLHFFFLAWQFSWCFYIRTYVCMQAYCYFSLSHLMSFSPMHRFFQALECLVRLVSVRRSLFTNDTMRLKYLAHLMTGTKEVMETGKGK